jgi:hypothetical protein
MTDMNILVAGLSLKHKQLVGDSSEGLNNRSIYINREDTCKKLFEKTTAQGFVLMKAPPRSGKTGLLQLLGTAVQQQLGDDSGISEVIFLSAAGIPDDCSWEDWFESQSGRKWSQVIRTSGD